MDRELQLVIRDAFAGVSLFFWSVQLLPQAWENYQNKSTKGLSILLLISWLAEAITFFSYGCSLSLSLPLLIQPEVFALVSILCYTQYLYYDRHWSLKRCMAIVAVIIAVVLTIELAGVVALAEAQDGPDTIWISRIFGILPTILILIGFASQYAETIQQKSARGLSIAFLVMDMLGAIAALISLLFHTHPDPEVALNYLSALIPDVGLLLLGAYYEHRERSRPPHDPSGSLGLLPKEEVEDYSLSPKIY